MAKPSNVHAVNRRVATLAIAAAGMILSSCATFNRNDVAARVGDHELTAKAAQALITPNDQQTVGDQLRIKLTEWIRADVMATRLAQPEFEHQVRALYEKGLGGSPAVCLAAIPVASLDATEPIMTALQSGTSFSDAAHQFSGSAELADSGGIVAGPDGGECMAPDALAATVADALQSTPVGQPLAADLDTFSAVLLLRPYDELSAESRASVAAASIGESQLASLYADARIYVDPRYGRWNPISQSVEPLRT